MGRGNLLFLRYFRNIYTTRTKMYIRYAKEYDREKRERRRDIESRER